MIIGYLVTIHENAEKWQVAWKYGLIQGLNKCIFQNRYFECSGIFIQKSLMKVSFKPNDWIWAASSSDSFPPFLA